MNKKLWQISTPKFVYSGQNSISFLAEILNQEQLERVFVVLDPGLSDTNFGLRVKELLEKYNTYYWSDFTTNPTLTQGEEGSKFFKESKGHCIIAIGGGSALDIAKYISLQNDFPTLIAIPTTCGTGAECSPYAIIKDEVKIKKMALEHELFVAKYVILDPMALLPLDKEMIAASALDTLSHAIEVHISKKADSLVRITTRGSLHTMCKYLEKAIEYKDVEALEALQNIAFTARLLYPKTGLSIAHSLAHPLGAYTDIHHGMLIGLLLPATIRFNTVFCQELVEEINNILGFAAGTEKDIVAWIEGIMVSSGISDKLRTDFQLIKTLPKKQIVAEAMQSSNLKSNPRPIQAQEELEDFLNLVLEPLAIN